MGLDPAQVEAVRITRGPLVVHAGARTFIAPIGGDKTAMYDKPQEETTT